MPGHRQRHRKQSLRWTHPTAPWPILRRCAGFTLIELMVAIILFALVSTAVYGSYSAVMRTTDGLYDHLDELERVRTCIAHIQADLANILVVPADQYKPPDQRPTPDAYQILADDDPGTGAFRFSFVSLNQLPISGSKYPEPMRIVYLTKRDRNGTWTLFRDQYPVDAQPPVDNQIPKLASGMAAISWKFIGYDGRPSEKWNSESANFAHATPQAIELILNFHSTPDQSNSKSHHYETQFALPMARKGAS